MRAAGREKADQGVDPIAERKSSRSRLKAEQAKAFTFKRSALAYIEAHESTWRNAKHAEQWRNTLASTYPVLQGNCMKEFCCQNSTQKKVDCSKNRQAMAKKDAVAQI